VAAQDRATFPGHGRHRRHRCALERRAGRRTAPLEDRAAGGPPHGRISHPPLYDGHGTESHRGLAEELLQVACRYGSAALILGSAGLDSLARAFIVAPMGRLTQVDSGSTAGQP
jgi:hypothetical protein